MNNYEIRLASLKDINQIMEIVKDAVLLLKSNNVNQWQNNYPNIEVITNDIKNRSMYVVSSEDYLVGFANLSISADPSYQEIYEGNWLTNNEYLVVHRIAVRNSYLNKGIAKLLFDKAESLAISNNVNSIRIDTHKDNVPMNKLLIKLGYVKCGIIYLINYLDSDKVRLAYEKVLK